jgi:Nif-specific regulatory protein
MPAPPAAIDAHILVRDPTSGPLLIPLLPAEPITLGRAPGNRVILHDERASRSHAELRLTPEGRWAIHDLNSRNGTLVDGKNVEGEQLLNDGDIIEIGAIEILYYEGSQPPEATSKTDSDTDSAGEGITGEMSSDVDESLPPQSQPAS